MIEPRLGMVVEYNEHGPTYIIVGLSTFDPGNGAIPCWTALKLENGRFVDFYMRVGDRFVADMVTVLYEGVQDVTG
jgi:hypothetical protein